MPQYLRRALHAWQCNKGNSVVVAALNYYYLFIEPEGPA